MTAARIAPHLQSYFTRRLQGQLGASPHTVASCRDSFRLVLRYAAERLGKAPSDMWLDDLDASLIVDFLHYIETERGCSARTRNIRLSAFRSFARHVALEEPAYAHHCQRILAIPHKRCGKSPVEFLSEEEILALEATPDPATWLGRRDRSLLFLAIQTGLRSSEITALRHSDMVLGTGAHVRCYGKGRKTRCTPLRSDVVAVLKAWLDEHAPNSQDFVFPSSRGGRLSADAFQRLVAKHTAAAALCCPTLLEKRVTPHALRHTAAMEMLRRGIDRSVIALWLGHESSETTQIYLHADLRLKEKALAHASPDGIPPARYQPSDELLAFLDGH